MATVAPAPAASRTAPQPAPRRRPRREKTRWWLYVVLFLGLVAMVMPFVWMILGSFKTDAEIRQYPTEFLPREPTVENYETLFGRLDFATFFVNSIVVAVFVTLGNIVFCSMIGYALPSSSSAARGCSSRSCWRRSWCRVW